MFTILEKFRKRNQSGESWYGLEAPMLVAQQVGAWPLQFGDGFLNLFFIGIQAPLGGPGHGISMGNLDFQG